MNLKDTFDIWKKTRGEEVKGENWYKNLLDKLNERDSFLNSLHNKSIQLPNSFLDDLTSRGSWWGGIYQGLPSDNNIEKCLKPCLEKCLEDIVNNHWDSTIGNWKSSGDISTIEQQVKQDFNKTKCSNNDTCNLERDFPALRNRILSCLFPEQMTTIFGESYFNKIWSKIAKNYGTTNNKKPDNYITRNQTLMEEVLGTFPTNITNKDIALAKIFFWELFESYYNIYELLQVSKQIILYGAPGTGKTYTAQQVVKEFVIKCENTTKQLEDEDKNSDSDIKLENYRFSKKCPLEVPRVESKPCKETGEKTGLYEIIQFHPNYTYQDFIGGISPNVSGTTIAYELKEGIFQRFCKVAEKNRECNFVLIIDEINRANLSEVFGELLYALEYRGKSINIPYFGEFKIPENVYIIGTMNDVDKSLVTFDLALRRRFGFFELAPNLDTLSNMFDFGISNLDQYITRCKKLNDKIKDKKDGLALEDSYQIGQAYFKKIENFLEKDKPDQLITPFELKKLWIYHIEPLLKEYLGMSLDGDDIKTKLDEVKTDFIKGL
jgi:Cdc6-like AAA superfamily ATPase